METFRILLVGDPQLEGQDKKDRLGLFIGIVLSLYHSTRAMQGNWMSGLTTSTFDTFFGRCLFLSLHRWWFFWVTCYHLKIYPTVNSTNVWNDCGGASKSIRTRYFPSFFGLYLCTQQHIRMVYLGGNHDIGMADVLIY